MTEAAIDKYFKWYKAQELESLDFCELKEFRKFALWHRQKELAKTIYNRMEELSRSGKVTSKERLAAAYL